MAASLARVHSRYQVRRQVRAELVDIAGINFVLAAERDLDNIVRQREEVLRDLRSARVGAVERRGENRALAGRVELEVDAALGEDGGFELVEGGVEGEGEGVDLLGGVFEESVLHHEADFELAFDDGEEFGGARVGVRGVHAAGLDEGYCAGDSFADEEGEVGLVGNKNAAAVTSNRRGLEVERDSIVNSLRVRKRDFALVVDGQQLLQTIDLGQVGVDLLGESCDSGWHRGRRDELGEASGLAAAVTGAGGVRGGGRARDRRGGRRPRVGRVGEGVRAGGNVDGLGLGEAGCEGSDGDLHHGRHVGLMEFWIIGTWSGCTKIAGVFLFGGKSV